MNGSGRPFERGSISVVIPSVRSERVVALVETITQAVGSEMAIVVVDDTRDKSVTAALASHVARHSGISVVSGQSRGPAVARNAGASAVQTEWVLFVDDDVEVGPAAFRSASEFARSHRVDEALEFAITSNTRADNGSWRWRRVQRVVPGGYLAAFLLVPRSAFLAVGGFEESWPYPFREDTDLGLRMAQAGTTWHFEPSPLVIHPDEPVVFKQLLRHAKFSAVEPLYLARHGMTGTVRAVKLGPVTVRGVRIWWPAASLIGVVALLLARKPIFGVLVAYASGALLSATHSHYLGRSEPQDIAIAVSPTRVAPWSAFSMIAGASFLQGWFRAKRNR